MVRKFAKIRRRDGSKASDHGIDVCAFALSLGLDRWVTDIHELDVECAALLLHDIEEDTKTTNEELKKEFGEEVAFLDNLYTCKPGMSRKEYIVKRIGSDIRTAFGKGCDRLLNLKGIKTFPIEKRSIYLKETEMILKVMKKGRRLNLEYSDALIAIREALKVVMEAWEENIELAKENERLKKKLNKRKK